MERRLEAEQFATPSASASDGAVKRLHLLNFILYLFDYHILTPTTSLVLYLYFNRLI